VVVESDLRVNGFARFPGGKEGYDADVFRNTSGAPLERGDLVVIGPEAPVGEAGPDIPLPGVHLADTAYDTRVCGVVRERVEPGETGHMVVVGCWAHCKADADISPIAPGDLLTTSPTPGHAQNAVDRVRAVGATVGKALAPLTSGKGTIPVLVCLQ
jgi:hypothetical protein